MNKKQLKDLDRELAGLNRKARRAEAKKPKFSDRIDIIISKMLKSGSPIKEYNRMKTVGLYNIADLDTALKAATEYKRNWL